MLSVPFTLLCILLVSFTLCMPEVFWGANYLRGTKILSQHHLFFFLSFLPSPYLPYKDTFMDDYNGI
jgi:hypothetical protein